MVPLLCVCERTERCRRLARDSTDPGLRTSLLSLAEEYAAKTDDQGVACLALIFTARSTLQKQN